MQSPSIGLRVIWSVFGTAACVGLVGCGEAPNPQPIDPAPCTSWTNVDDYQGPGTNTFGRSLAQDPTGTVYRTGGFAGSDTSFHWFVRRSSDGSANWTLVDDFQRSPNNDTSVSGVVAPSNGVVLVAGESQDEMGLRYATLRRSKDSGMTWENDFFQPEADIPNAVWRDIGVDIAGSIYLMGGGTSGGVFHWIVRKSVDGGQSHTPIDDYVHPDSDTNTARGIIDDASGKLYVIGTTQKTGVIRWITRSNANGTFETIDDYQYPGGTNTYGFQLVRHPSGSLLGVGHGMDSAGKFHCLVRLRSPGETTWNLVDDFQFRAGQDCYSFRLIVDAAGTLYAVANGQATTVHALIRRSTDGGMTWSTFADYEFTKGKDSYSDDLLQDSSGALLWSVTATDSVDQSHSLIRRLACTE